MITVKIATQIIPRINVELLIAVVLKQSILLNEQWFDLVDYLSGITIINLTLIILSAIQYIY